MQIQISWLLKPTDLYLHCLPFSLWIFINNLDQVIWLAKKLKMAWHLNLFSRTRVKYMCQPLKHVIGVDEQSCKRKLLWWCYSLTQFSDLTSLSDANKIVSALPTLRTDYEARDEDIGFLRKFFRGQDTQTLMKVSATHSSFCASPATCISNYLSLWKAKLQKWLVSHMRTTNAQISCAFAKTDLHLRCPLIESLDIAKYTGILRLYVFSKNMFFIHV